MKRMWLSFMALMLIAPLAFGQARDFPNKPVKVIVPYSPGSGADTFARFYADKLAAILGQPFVVENRPGGGTVIGVMAVKSAPADGYSILLATNATLSVLPLTMKDLPFDSLKDLKPLYGLGRAMNAFIVAADSKLITIADLVAAAKSSKVMLNAGTYSPGYHLALEWFANVAGVKFTNIPYKSVAPVFTDIMGKQIDFAITDSTGNAASLLKSGKIRALAVAGETRHPEFPDVPTVRESGYPSYTNYGWSAYYVRSETPEDVTAKLVDALQKIQNSNEPREFMKKLGLEVMPFAPAAMAKYHRDVLEDFRRVAEQAGIKPE